MARQIYLVLIVSVLANCLIQANACLSREAARVRIQRIVQQNPEVRQYFTSKNQAPPVSPSPLPTSPAPINPVVPQVVEEA